VSRTKAARHVDAVRMNEFPGSQEKKKSRPDYSGPQIGSGTEMIALESGSTESKVHCNQTNVSHIS